MVKVSSIGELEDFLLADSTLDDMCGKLPNKQNPEKLLTADDVKHDISAFARYLIRVYVGWPVHDDIIKRKVLNYLIKIYKSAHRMTAIELFNLLKIAIEPIPDNHLSIRFNGARARMTIKTRLHKDVGQNIAGKSTIKAMMMDNNVAVIGFTGMRKTDEFRDVILAFQKDILPKSKALIIDLRGNGGGNSFYSDRFAYFLCGTKISSMKETYVRTTPEAKKVLQESNPEASWSNVPMSEDLQLFSTGEIFEIDKKQAYMKPIFVLTDEHTGSGAEMFLLRMVHHPMVRVIGDNSSGMEVYGNMVFGKLPHSDVFVAVGSNYRILEYDNFELHGYKPDIKCKDGTNAFDVALKEISKPLEIMKFHQSVKS